MDNIFVVSSEEQFVVQLKDALPTTEGLVIQPDPEAALTQVMEASPRVVLLDCDAFSDPLTLLRRFKKIDARLPVILFSEMGEIAKAVIAVKMGATDFLQKPVDGEKLSRALEKAAQGDRISPFLQTQGLRDRAWLRFRSQSMENFLQDVQTITRTDADVAILSEPGLDQRGTAKLIHDNTVWLKDRQFVSIDLKAFSHEASESHFWGTIRKILQESDVKTLASKEERTGTVYLENFTRLSPHFQESLLSFLKGRKERTYQGGVDKEIRVIFGMIWGPEELEEKLQETFELELVKVVIPPLRERREDLPLLLAAYVALFSAQYRTNVAGVAPALLEDLQYYDWPGNLWEFQNVVRLAFFASVGERVVGEEAVDTTMLVERHADQALASGVCDLQSVREIFERDLLSRFLKVTKGDGERVAELLDIPKTLLEQKRDRLGVG